MSRRRPNFSTRTAEEDVSRLDPNEQGDTTEDRGGFLHWPSNIWPRHHELSSTEPADGRRHSLPSNFLGGLSLWWNKATGAEHDHEGAGQSGGFSQLALSAGPLRDSSVDKKDRNGHRPRATEESKKLGTFSGVFVPTTLNVLSILMFLRFGFILGQAGLLGILGRDYPSKGWDIQGLQLMTP